MMQEKVKERILRSVARLSLMMQPRQERKKRKREVSLVAYFVGWNELSNQTPIRLASILAYPRSFPFPSVGWSIK